MAMVLGFWLWFVERKKTGYGLQLASKRKNRGTNSLDRARMSERDLLTGDSVRQRR